jgi:hypothetical protein
MEFRDIDPKKGLQKAEYDFLYLLQKIHPSFKRKTERDPGMYPRDLSKDFLFVFEAKYQGRCVSVMILFDGRLVLSFLNESCKTYYCAKENFELDGNEIDLNAGKDEDDDGYDDEEYYEGEPDEEELREAQEIIDSFDYDDPKNAGCGPPSLRDFFPRKYECSPISDLDVLAPDIESFLLFNKFNEEKFDKNFEDYDDWHIFMSVN